MTTMNVSGTPEQVMQVLADEIGKLSIRITKAEDDALASRAIIQVLLHLLSKSESLNLDDFYEIVETSAQTYEAKAQTVPAEAAERLRRIAGEVRTFRVDLSKGATSPPPFEIIDGGKAD